jgi:hypothetical protein
VSTALAIVVEDGDTVAEANTRVTVLKLMMDAGWSRPAASAIATTWLPLDAWGHIGLQRRSDWISAYHKPDNLKGTLAFLSEFLRTVLGEKVGIPLQSAENSTEAKKLARYLWEVLAR